VKISRVDGWESGHVYHSKFEFSMYASTSNLVSSSVESASSINAAIASSSNLGSTNIIGNSFDSLIIAKNPHCGGFGVHFDYWHMSWNFLYAIASILSRTNEFALIEQYKSALDKPLIRMYSSNDSSKHVS